MEFLYEYGLFLAKSITIVVSVALIIGLMLSAAVKNKSGKKGELRIENISDSIKEQIESIKRHLLSKSEQKQFDKELKKQHKAEEKQSESQDKKHKVFVIDFNGGVYANEVENLREEISAVVAVAEKGDKVLLKLESPGGVVHGYGLAASQLTRLKEKGVELIAAVDKVAASGGYMMACVADKIICAPFAIIGSVGVVAQLPNFNKLLKKNDIEIEQHTAGEFKRTLTMLGENTDEARNKFKQELEDTHVLFKQFVSDNRAGLDIEKIATGEHWYGMQALDLKLVDEIKTSDDAIMELYEEYDLFEVEHKLKQSVAEKLGIAASQSVLQLTDKLATRFSKSR